MMIKYRVAYLKFKYKNTFSMNVNWSRIEDC